MPKPTRPLFRLIATIVVAGLTLAKLLRIPRRLIPKRKLRGIYDNWTGKMRFNYVKSLGRKLPHDELCTMRMPESFRPKVEVDPAYRLSEAQIRGFYENGYLEPFRVWPAERMKAFGERLLELRQEKSTIYGFAADRDRHLEWPQMMQLLAEPAITERLAQLLGPDLVAWRSQVFFKPPGNNPVGWHQASTYMFEEDFVEPTIHPPDVRDLFQLTVWIAVDPATVQNGCLKFERGSMKAIRWMRLGGKIGFHDVNYGPDYEVDESKVARVPADAGEAVVFSERTVHGSDPNTTDHNRLAFNMRVVPADVGVYRPGKRRHRSAQMGRTYDLTRWNAVLLRGEEAGVNNAVPWRRYAGEPGTTDAIGAPRGKIGPPGAVSSAG